MFLDAVSTILKIFVPNQNMHVKDIQLFPNLYSMPPRLHFFKVMIKEQNKQIFKNLHFFCQMNCYLLS